jgi:catechol 2,3-dioxygenase-like lactoylglutathione lyase family enzyme
MKPVFCAGFGPIVDDLAESREFYEGTLGIELEPGDYAATNQLEGVKHFGLWKLSDAAQSCFGTATWPTDVPRPQGGIEFDLESPAAVADAVEELRARGLAVLCGPKEEPWGQTVARLLSPEGLLVGVVFTPWLHDVPDA